MIHLQERWIAINGSIFTEAKRRHPLLGGREAVHRDGIAYNVGADAAEHIVKLHNDSLAAQASPALASQFE